MKHLFKLLFFAILLVFSLCVVAFAENATVAASTQLISSGIYKLVVTGASPSTVEAINTAEVILSYDNTVVVPVDKIEHTDIAIMENSIQGSTAPVDSALTLAPIQWIVSGQRTALKATVYATEGIDARAGIAVCELYFRVISGEIVDRATFRIETDFSNGSVLNEIYGGVESSKGCGFSIGENFFATTNTLLIDNTTYNGLTFSSVAEKVKMGDINIDGKVSIIDSVILVQHLSSPETVILKKNEKKAADCFYDTKINTKDAVRLKQHLASPTTIILD